MKKNIIIFEAEGGSDKCLDGHRKDTMPIIDAIKKHGWDAEVIFFRDEWADEIFDYANNKFDAYVSRVNPGNLISGEKNYFKLLRKLSAAGLVGMPHPDVMINFGSKDALVKLIETDLVPNDTFAYYDVETFQKHFPKSISYGVRVLKQNRGSTGEGIWRVEIADNIDHQIGERLPLNTQLKCTEAVDNHVEYNQLGDFISFCEQYIVGDNGLLVDMPFLPRIVEGEIRVLMVGEKPIFIVHKKPAMTQDAFSATLFSGAEYSYSQAEDWPELIEIFIPSIPILSEKLAATDVPLIWSADFMLDYDERKNNKYILGEINCSCVGFTTHLNQGIQDIIAQEVIARVRKYKELANPPLVINTYSDGLLA